MNSLFIYKSLYCTSPKFIGTRMNLLSRHDPPYAGPVEDGGHLRATCRGLNLTASAETEAVAADLRCSLVPCIATDLRSSPSPLMALDSSPAATDFGSNVRFRIS
jgi:hypothetical protein